LGFYNPQKKQRQFVLNFFQLAFFLNRGAKLSKGVKKLFIKVFLAGGKD